MPAAATSSPLPYFIAADVGGTHVRVGLVQARDSGAAVEVIHHRKYLCADYADLGVILQEFVAEGGAYQSCVVACPGAADAQGNWISANLPWPVLPALLQQQLGVPVTLMNDFQALAHAAPQMRAHTLAHLSGPATATGPVLVIGPGTGLGTALWVPTANGPLVLASEAGQANLPTGSAHEQALATVMAQTLGRVTIEHALSGPGLAHLYRAQCQLQQVPATLASPEAISAAAIAGDDPAAEAALATFCALLGSVCGDLALACGATGGLYLAGGVLPHISGYLANSAFRQRLLDKGVMRPHLEALPVHLVEHGQLGIIGAALWHLQQRPH